MRFDIYKCEGCGLVVEVVESHNCVLNCGSRAMTKKTVANHTGEAIVHVPIITETPTGYAIKVSTQQHPMIPSHYIELIELVADGVRYAKYLSPGDVPEAEFSIPKAAALAARIYCNLHGVWES